jgi:hypothetical protein
MAVLQPSHVNFRWSSPENSVANSSLFENTIPSWRAASPEMRPTDLLARHYLNMSGFYHPMKFASRYALLLLVALTALIGAAAAPATIGYFDAIAADPFPTVGQQYYVRHCFMYEKGVSLTTNYWRGTLVPINSQVTLVSIGGKKMVLRLANGGTIKVENVEKYSKRSMSTISRDLLAPNPVPVEKFGATIADAIKNGVLKLGMTREQVVMARGYPPGHKTPSLDNDTWIYWSSRFVMDTIVFSDGVLVRGRGLEQQSPNSDRHPSTAPAPSAPQPSGTESLSA